MRRFLTLLTIFTLVSTASTARAASPVIDDVNDGRSPGNFVFASNVTKVGWIYEPSFDYQLDGITSTFRAVTNPTGTRDVTLSVYDEVGGTVLRTGTFPAGGGGGNLGIMFQPLEVQSGEDYFILYENVYNANDGGLGLNIVDFGVSLPGGVPDPAVDFFNGWYLGDSLEFIPHTTNSPAGFAAPILRFHGVVPEPSFAMLAAIALGIASVRGARRRSTSA